MRRGLGSDFRAFTWLSGHPGLRVDVQPLSEAYQLLNFEASEVKPLCYHDDPEDPRVISVGSFSKLIGPGLKVGWIQAHPVLLQQLARAGYVASGGNPVTFASVGLVHLLRLRTW